MKQRKIQNEDGGWKWSPKQSQTGQKVPSFSLVCCQINSFKNLRIKVFVLGMICASKTSVLSTEYYNLLSDLLALANVSNVSINLLW